VEEINHKHRLTLWYENDLIIKELLPTNVVVNVVISTGPCWIDFIIVVLMKRSFPYLLHYLEHIDD